MGPPACTSRLLTAASPPGAGLGSVAAARGSPLQAPAVLPRTARKVGRRATIELGWGGASLSPAAGVWALPRTPPPPGRDAGPGGRPHWGPGHRSPNQHQSGGGTRRRGGQRHPRLRPPLVCRHPAACIPSGLASCRRCWPRPRRRWRRWTRRRRSPSAPMAPPRRAPATCSGCAGALAAARGVGSRWLHCFWAGCLRGAGCGMQDSGVASPRHAMEQPTTAAKATHADSSAELRADSSCSGTAARQHGLEVAGWLRQKAGTTYSC